MQIIHASPPRSPSLAQSDPNEVIHPQVSRTATPPDHQLHQYGNPHAPAQNYRFSHSYSPASTISSSSDEDHNQSSSAAAAHSSSAAAASSSSTARPSKQQQPAKASKSHILAELHKASKNGVLHGEPLARYNRKMESHNYVGSLGRGAPFTLNHFDVEDLRTMYKMHVYGKKPP